MRLCRGTPQFLKRVDAEWLQLRHDDDDTTVAWKFYDFGSAVTERFVLAAVDESPLAAWLDQNGALICKDAYRLDFFKVRPDRVGAGVGLLALGLVAERALELSAHRAVFQAPRKNERCFRVRAGATDCPDWKGNETLPNLELNLRALERLREHLSGRETRQH